LTIRKYGTRGAVVARIRSTSSSDRRSSNPPGPAAAVAVGAVGAVAVGAVGAVAVDPVGAVTVGAVGVLGVGHGGRRGRGGPLGVLTPGGDDILVLDTRGAVAHGALLGGSAAETATLAPLGGVETPAAQPMASTTAR
jgi:hypothetical protein